MKDLFVYNFVQIDEIDVTCQLEHCTVGHPIRHQ